MVSERRWRSGSATSATSGCTSTAARYPPFGPRSIHHPPSMRDAYRPSPWATGAVSRSKRVVIVRVPRRRSRPSFDGDGELWAAVGGELRLRLGRGGELAVDEQDGVAVVVAAEQVRCQGVAATMALATIGVEADAHQPTSRRSTRGPRTWP